MLDNSHLPKRYSLLIARKPAWLLAGQGPAKIIKIQALKPAWLLL